MSVLIDPVILKVKEAMERHRLPDGSYCRMYGGTKPDPYGCADALNLFYTVNEQPEEWQRKVLVSRIRSFQDPVTGLFSEDTHHPYHCTAHCMAALALVGKKADHPVYEMEKYADPDGIPGWLETVDSAHIGAGVFSVRYLQGEMSLEWQDAFFGFFDRAVDPRYGISRRGDIDSGRKPDWLFMGDWFHYLFCYYACHRPFPEPQRLVDTCIELYRNRRMPESFGKGQRFLDIDWAFSLYRGSAQAGYRLEEARALLKEFALLYVEYLERSSMEEIQWGDMHLLFGAVCGLAELQIALPGELYSTRPLRQVLDVRPFI